MAPISELSDGQLDELTTVDGVDHVALGAVLRDDPNEGIGVARFIRLEQEPGVAEAAVTVLDDYQGRGLGTLLVVLLGQVALALGVTAFRGFVLEENLPMRRMLEALGARTHHDSPGVVRIDVPLLPVQPPDSPARQILKAVAEGKVIPVPPGHRSSGAQPAGR